MSEKTMTTEKALSVHQAWAGVQGDVLSVRKDQQVTAGPARFNFRGIDGVMNAVGPALRTHGVHIRPVKVDVERRDTKTSGGKDSRETCVMVTYEVTGPAGDSFTGVAPGESLDNGDKGTAKAMSVAYRTFLLQALTIPTDESDPDATTYQRESQARPAGQHQQRHQQPQTPVDSPEMQAVKRRIYEAVGRDSAAANAAVQQSGTDYTSVASMAKLAEQLEQRPVQQPTNPPADQPTTEGESA